MDYYLKKSEINIKYTDINIYIQYWSQYKVFVLDSDHLSPLSLKDSQENDAVI